MIINKDQLYFILFSTLLKKKQRLSPNINEKILDFSILEKDNNIEIKRIIFVDKEERSDKGYNIDIL